jgi:hypothetical protein
MSNSNSHFQCFQNDHNPKQTKKGPNYEVNRVLQLLLVYLEIRETPYLDM